MSERCDMRGAKNLRMMVVQSVLFLYCDLSKDCGESTSGKSVLISSSSGNKPLGKSGAFLGLNVFIKSLDKRDLSSRSIEALRTTSFTDVGDGCQWRIEEDGVTLCIRVDFATVKKRLGASGKSMLLATTGGNKPIGGTGLKCGLNCYHPVDKVFDASQLAAGNAGEDELQVGQTQSMEGGFVVSYTTPTEMHVTYTYRAEEMANGHTASLPACLVGDLKVTVFVCAPKVARARTEKTAMKATEEDEKPPASLAPTPFLSQASGANCSGRLSLERGKDSKVRNITVTCTAVPAQGEEAAASPGSHSGAYAIDLRFDPTLSFGRSLSGKWLTVASTGGFQRVVDAEDRAVCRFSLYAGRSAPPLSEAKITAAVRAVLAAKPKARLPSLSFKEVLTEVMSMLGVSEAMKEAVKPKIKEAVVAFVQAAAT
ncbi:conserved hypothetical protein [Leishmania infantum JPCM5]|uniref:Uncharacterized protein n=2 Tax=Leishmania infantum TaxID=5671 RepID=A4I3A5_LEIIN|nr:conserved hypothetical protein [Leishmania infantum JPCM5]CAC9501779.1 hypothetical_protein_-_conserved [Leishmania infantum]CAM69259.1 conserved hypothetical protein [Leishmania infantum JPCM5]SUZ43194.1 hypothetical_protein_-_conserved [Leishmania infantum]|eukprot:XP_001470067.1 conserved hypothetical protein [Leishmania infantum JPCM5]